MLQLKINGFVCRNVCGITHMSELLTHLKCCSPGKRKPSRESRRAVRYDICPMRAGAMSVIFTTLSQVPGTEPGTEQALEKWARLLYLQVYEYSNSTRSWIWGSKNQNDMSPLHLWCIHTRYTTWRKKGAGVLLKRKMFTKYMEIWTRL